MGYISVHEAAEKWELSERSVRNYCASGRVPSAYLAGKIWRIPDSVEKPERAPRLTTPKNLLESLRSEKHGA